jgi:hypothetical protein
MCQPSPPSGLGAGKFQRTGPNLELVIELGPRRIANPSDWASSYAVSTIAPRRPSHSIAWSRSLNFWILPVTVIGNSSTEIT